MFHFPKDSFILARDSSSSTSWPFYTCNLCSFKLRQCRSNCEYWHTHNKKLKWIILVTWMTVNNCLKCINRRGDKGILVSSLLHFTSDLFASWIDWHKAISFFLVLFLYFFGILQNITLLTIHYDTQLQYVTYNNLLRTHY